MSRIYIFSVCFYFLLICTASFNFIVICFFASVVLCTQLLKNQYYVFKILLLENYSLFGKVGHEGRYKGQGQTWHAQSLFMSLCSEMTSDSIQETHGVPGIAGSVVQTRPVCYLLYYFSSPCQNIWTHFYKLLNNLNFFLISLLEGNVRMYSLGISA